MATFYFDTSAIVKRYHKEPGTDVLDKIFELRKNGFATSFWTVLEFTVAFSIRTRRRELSREAFNVALSRFLKDLLDRFAITSVNDELVASATPLAVKHALPSADCLQLASATHLKRALEGAKEKLVLVFQTKTYAKQPIRKESISSIQRRRTP